MILALTVFSAFTEVVSLGAVLPFIGILVSPERVFTRPGLAALLRSWGIDSASGLVLPLTLAFMAAAVVAATIRIFLLWASTRLAFATGADLSIEIYRRTLYQPYRVHVSRNSSEVISGITNKVAGAVNVLYNGLTLTSSAVLIAAIVIALLIISPFVAIVSILTFGGGYGLVTKLTRARLRLNSARIANAQTEVVQALQEGLGGIRDVLLDGTQPVYCDAYRRADEQLRRADGNNNFIGGCPRFAIEALGMILIAAIAYALSRAQGGLGASLPSLAALALGAQRLLPALQNGYSAWASMAGNEALMSDALSLLEQEMPSASVPAPAEPLCFREAIQLRHVRFRYAEEAPWVLDDVNLEIRKGARVGIVGATGSGKSTLLDILMMLLAPTEGELLVDGEVISEHNVRSWQRSIAHVPQSIFLADSTLAQNIAFGVAPEEIDLERVRQAARQAHIADFIESRRDGYFAFVGERGIRLSGGQRQRVGIARALYKEAQVLIFDEATSALDNATERSVIDAIEALNRELTVLFVAHRLTTVHQCDVIFEFVNGRVVAQGTYGDLLERSASFRQMALSVA